MAPDWGEIYIKLSDVAYDIRDVLVSLENTDSGEVLVDNSDVLEVSGMVESEVSDDSSYTDMKERLEMDLGWCDPIRQCTSAGYYITDLCKEVESNLGVWLRRSVQTGIWIYTLGDDTCVAANIDYQDFNSDVIGIALRSDSKESFKSNYKAFLADVIAANPCGE